MPPRKVEKKLDIAKLQKMQEPITVQVYRVKGGNKIPISPPSKVDGPPGTGWSRDDVLQLHTWVQNNAGGGFYEATATDAKGDSMAWPFGWDPRIIPEKVPPTDQANAMPTPAPVPGMAGAPVAPGQAVPLPMDPMLAAAALGSNSTSWLAGGGFYPYQQQPQPQQPQPQPQQPYMYGGMPFGNPWWQQQQWGASTPRMSNDPSHRERDLESQLRQTQMAQQQAQYQQQIDRLQMQHATELAQLREELRRAADKRPGESDEVRELKAQLAAQQQQQQWQQQMQMMQQNTQAQIDALKELVVKSTENKGESAEVREMREQQRRLEERLERERAEQRHRDELAEIRRQMDSNKGPDPMLEYLKENSRQQLEAQKEIVRNQRETTQMTTGMMVNPMQMMEMMQRQSGQSDAVTKQLIENFGAGFETYRLMMESLMQMQGGGQSPGMAMLSEGLQRAGEIANQYITAQRDMKVHEARANAQAASAQAKTAEAYRAQAEASARVTPRTYDEDMLTGATSDAGAGANGANGANGSGDVDADVINLDERRPPTEAEMFGHPEVLKAVYHLRAGVAEGKLDPHGAVNAILQGIAQCEQNQIIVPAFVLFAEGRFADLMDTLLPKAPQDYRDMCVQIFTHQFNEEEDDESEEPEAPPPPA